MNKTDKGRILTIIGMIAMIVLVFTRVLFTHQAAE